MSTVSQRQQWFEREKIRVSYQCDACELAAKGYIGDLLEAPWLYCPECGQEMELAVES